MRWHLRTWLPNLAPLGLGECQCNTIIYGSTSHHLNYPYFFNALRRGMAASSFVLWTILMSISYRNHGLLTGLESSYIVGRQIKDKAHDFSAGPNFVAGSWSPSNVLCSWIFNPRLLANTPSRRGWSLSAALDIAGFAVLGPQTWLRYFTSSVKYTSIPVYGKVWKYQTTCWQLAYSVRAHFWSLLHTPRHGALRHESAWRWWIK